MILEAPLGAAMRALATQPLVPRHIARAFSVFLDARRAVFFLGERGIIAAVGTDERGASIRRYARSAFEMTQSVMHGEGPDGLLPIADPDPGYWLTIRFGDEQPHGAIVLTGLVGALSSETLALIDAFVDLTIGRLIAHKELLQARHSALTDELTGALLKRAKDEVITSMTSYSIIVVDLDNFKEINDEFGHAKGDEVLKNTGKVLRNMARPGDAVIRWGGDEFVLVMPNTLAKPLAMRVSNTLKANRIAASVGAANVPQEGPDWDTGFNLADARMYEDKHAPGKKPRERRDSRDRRQADEPASS